MVGGMTMKLGLMSATVAILLSVAVAAYGDAEVVEKVVYTTSSHSSGESMMEAQNVRIKLSSAEERVKALVSKLDAVSEDASRARLEIHSTLTEAWNIVDLLGKDRCGEAVLEVRKKQQAAEEQVTRLQKQFKEKSESSAGLETSMQRLNSEVTEVRKSYELEKSRREELDIELGEVRSRLKQAVAIGDRSDSFAGVQTQVKQLIAKMGERTEMLRQIMSFVKTDLQESEGMDTQIAEIRSMLLEYEEAYTTTISSLKMDQTQVMGMSQRQKELEKQLHDALRDREENLRKFERLQEEVGRVQSRSNSSVVVEKRSSWFSTLVLMLISVLFGILLVTMGRQYNFMNTFFSNEHDTGDGHNSNVPQSPYGGQYASGNPGATPHPKTSLGGRSTPQSRPSTGGNAASPGGDFFHGDRSPMTYVRAGGSPKYRDY